MFVTSHERIRRGAKLLRQDVTAAIFEVSEISRDLQNHYNAIVASSSAGAGSRMDVCVICYMFCFMLEVAWSILVHASMNQRPVIFQKEPSTKSSFVLHPVRNGETINFKYPAEQLGNLPPAVRDAYIGMMNKLVPYKACRPQSLVYNKVGYWTHVARFIRDVSTHRGLSLIQLQLPEDIRGGGGPSRAHVKVPTSPAASTFVDVPSNGAPYLPPHLAPWESAIELSHNGFWMAPVGLVIESIVKVSQELCKEITAMLTMLESALPDALAPPYNVQSV